MPSQIVVLASKVVLLIRDATRFSSAIHTLQDGEKEQRAGTSVHAKLVIANSCPLKNSAIWPNLTCLLVFYIFTFPT